MSKKTIWVINQFAGTPVSGWGERHYFLSKKWIREGFDVKIISGSFNHMFNHFPETPSLFNKEIYEGTEFWWVKTPRYNPKSVLRFWSMIVFSLRCWFLPIHQLGKPDVIVISSMPIFPVLTCYFLKLRYGAKLIFEIRDLWPLTPIHLMGFSKWHPMILLMSWLEKLGYRKADHIVSVLPNSAAYITGISKDASKFNYIPNGISKELLGDESIPQDIVDSLPKEKFIIGYTGTINMANALQYFVEAAILLKDHPDFHFVIVGDGYAKKELQEATKGLNNFSFVPKIRKAQIQDMLSYFDVCFIGRNDTPLFNHGVSSNKYFDYMLACKPVLVSSNRIKDPVELSGCGIIVQPESGEAIKEGVLQLFAISAKERCEMAKRGFEYVQQYHNFNYLSDKYITLFSE